MRCTYKQCIDNDFNCLYVYFFFFLLIHPEHESRNLASATEY